MLQGLGTSAYIVFPPPVSGTEGKLLAAALGMLLFHENVLTGRLLLCTQSVATWLWNNTARSVCLERCGQRPSRHGKPTTAKPAAKRPATITALPLLYSCTQPLPLPLLHQDGFHAWPLLAIASTSAVCVLHLLAMAFLPQSTYVRRRTSLIITVRVLEFVSDCVININMKVADTLLGTSR